MSGARPSDQALVASDEASSGLHPAGFDPSRELLAKVLAFYEGRDPYAFYRIHNAEQRANDADDAMQEIIGEIRALLDRKAR